MTRDEIMALSPEQLRVEIAKAKGYKDIPNTIDEALKDGWRIADDWEVCGSSVEYKNGRRANDRIYLNPPYDRKRLRDFPNYPADIAAAYDLIDDIGACENEFVDILKEVIHYFHGQSDKPLLWHMVHATPDELSRAWLIWNNERKAE